MMRTPKTRCVRANCDGSRELRRGTRCQFLANYSRGACHVSDFLVERLVRWGVRRIYGYPGDGINGIMGALNVRQGKMLVRAPTVRLLCE